MVDNGSSGGEQTTIAITDAIRGYFEAFGENSPAREAMLDDSRPGSAAYAYATYWWSLFLAAPDSFPQEIGFEPGEAYACIAPEDANELSSGCLTYTDFVIDSESGLLVDFAEAGRAMSQSAVLADDAAASADGVSVRVVVAKQVSEDLISVVWETINDGDVDVEGQVRIISEAGDIVQVDAWTQNDVPAGSSVLNAANISIDELGGDLQYRIVATGTVLQDAIPTP